MQVDAGAAAPKPRTRTTHTPDGKYQFALSEDGLRWQLEEGVRVPQEHHLEAYSLYVSVHVPWTFHAVIVVSCLGFHVVCHVWAMLMGTT